MGEKREIVCRYVGKGLSIGSATAIAKIKRSTYYYRPTGGLKGKQPSTHTFHYLNGYVSNEVVVKDILELIDPEYNDYGYQTVTPLLKRQGYLINHKKAYRLMRDNNLLHPKSARSVPSGKTFIDFTVPPLEGPFRTVEVDIKYIYIHGEKRNAFLVSFLCTFCRCNPVWELNYTMTSAQVIALLNAFLNHPIVRKYLKNKKLIIKIRTDNGPQFIAKKLAEAIKKEGLEHEFIRPGTPQQNGHIESFHSTVTRLLCNRNIFEDLNHANEVFKEFFFAYNNTRVMKSLLYFPPVQFLNVWQSGNVGIKRDRKGREIFYFREKPAPLKETDPPSEALLGLNKYITFDNRVLTTKKNSPV